MIPFVDCDNLNLAEIVVVDIHICEGKCNRILRKKKKKKKKQ